MTTNKLAQLRPANAQNARPTWGDKYDQLHRCPPPHDPKCVYVDDVALGMFDQDDLYPHLITEFRGARVAVPLGDAGYCDNEDYVVAPLCYQPLPQREISWGRSYPIHRIKLMRVWREKHSSPSMIRTLEGGRMELYCVNPRGMFVWLPILGCTTGKRAGRIYDKWEIFVMRDGEVQSMVRCDDLEFEHWPED